MKFVISLGWSLPLVIAMAILPPAGLRADPASTGAAPAAPGESAAARLAAADALLETGRKLRRAGNSAEAEAILKQALDIRRDVLGPDDPAVAQATDDVASVYYNRGQFSEAEALYRQALGIYEKAQGPRSLDVANTLGNLGAALREEGKFAEAETTVQRSISIRALLLPRDDPAIGASLNNLGRNYLKQGRYIAAKQALTECLRIYQKAYGNDAASVQQTRSLLDLVKRDEDAPPPTDIVAKGAPAEAPLKLNSGQSVTISAFGPYVAPNGWAGEVLIYETATPASQPAKLRREVDEIWNHFILDVNKAGYDKAIIVAKPSAAKGGAASAVVNFLFIDQADGWKTAEFPERVKAGLDRAFVKEFIARYDWLCEHHDGFAAGLYLAKGWTAAAKITVKGETKTVTLDRDQFVAAVQMLDATVKDYAHHREIVAISIEPDHRSARIESRETESSERNGVKLETAGTSVDLLLFDGDHLTFTQSFEQATMTADKPL